MPEKTKAVGLIISEKLKAMGLSQKEFAEQVGVKESSISHYINGERVPRGAILLKIANLLNISTETLLGIKDEDSSEEKQLSFETVHEFLFRNGKDLTPEQKRKLVEVLIQ